MSKHPFSTNIKDIDTGAMLVMDFECFIEFDTDGDEPEIVAVWDYDGKVCLSNSKDKFTEWLCQRVLDAAEHDLHRRGPLFTAVLERIEEEREYDLDEYGDWKLQQRREASW